jgi:hypothetical protein
VAWLVPLLPDPEAGWETPADPSSLSPSPVLVGLVLGGVVAPLPLAVVECPAGRVKAIAAAAASPASPAAAVTALTRARPRSLAATWPDSSGSYLMPGCLLPRASRPR